MTNDKNIDSWEETIKRGRESTLRPKQDSNVNTGFGKRGGRLGQTPKGKVFDYPSGGQRKGKVFDK